MRVGPAITTCEPLKSAQSSPYTMEYDDVSEGSTAVTQETSATSLGRRIGGGFIAIVVLVVVYYLGGMIWTHRISDDPDYKVEEMMNVKGSRAVAIAADLIDREVNQNGWIANDPPFMPGYLLDNMPNFQTGIIQALSRFSVELTDHVARVRGSSQLDEDANRASGRLKYPGDVWIFEWSATPVQPSSESQYRQAMDDLMRYNRRLEAGSAMFEPRSDNLLATLDRIASDIGSASAAIAEKTASTGFNPLDFSADDLFYLNKGKLYGYYMILRELRYDFAAVIEERKLTQSWDAMLSSMRAAAELYPWVVANGSLDSQLRPNHLASQGFLLLRARTQLREISNILLK